MIVQPIPPEFVSWAEFQSLQIVIYARGHGLKDQAGNDDPRSHQKGIVGMLMLEKILQDAGVDVFLDHEMVGRTDLYDIHILGERHEVKTGVHKMEFGSLENAVNNPKFNFLVKKHQYDKGNFRGVRTYISMLITDDWAQGAYCGYIDRDLIPEYPAAEKGNGEISMLSYQIPFNELKTSLSFTP